MSNNQPKPYALPLAALSLTVLALICTGLLANPAAAQEPEQRSVNNGNVVLDGVPELDLELGAKLDRFLNTRSSSFRGWTPEGGMYVATRFGNTTQLHRVDHPGGARHQLTFFDEPIGAVRSRPNGTDLIFSMDAGGSEFSQLFLLDPKTGDSTMVTDGESRNGVALWSEDGKSLAFQSTRRNGSSNDVWIVEPEDPDSARLVLESPDGAWWGPADFSADGGELLVMQYVSVNDSRVYLLDLETKDQYLIAGDPDDPSSWLGIAPQFDHAGTGVFLSTDKLSDFTQLAHLDLASGEIQVITEDIPWNIEAFTLNEDRTRAAFAANIDGQSQIYLLDPASREYRAAENLPPGLAFNLKFAPDDKTLTVGLNTASTPSDVFTLALAESALDAGELTRWTYSEVGGLDTTSLVQPELIHYPTFDQIDGEPRMIPAFVYEPQGDGPHPVIIDIHGGPESQYRPSFSSTYQSWISTLDAAVIAPNVRGSSGYGKAYVKLDNGFLREDSVKDIGALLDWIAQEPTLDETRVMVVGGSYGGYMVLASMVHYGDRLQGGIDVVGISNFVTFLENTQDYRRDLRRAEYGDEREPAMREHLEEISPSNSADKITAPLFVAQGANDPRVPITEAEQIVEAVRASGYDVWYMNALNEGHGFGKKENSDLYLQLAGMFLQRHLAQPETENE